MSPRSREALVAVACIAFVGWFLMKFHMDTANDSETQAYVASLITSATTHSLSTDAAGQYAALAPYLMWPVTSLLQPITGAYLIRGLVAALLVFGIALNAATYVWLRTLGVTWFTSLIGLILLSTSAAFAMEFRGWEIDKLVEPVVCLLAALAAWHRRWPAFVVFAALAAANRETGIFVPFVALVAADPESNPLRTLVRRPAFWLALAICAVEVLVLRHIAPSPHVTPWAYATPVRFVNVLGGLCLLPVLALAVGRAAPIGLRWLLYAVTPVWVLVVLATEQVDQGFVLLAPLAVVWLPVSLLGVEALIRAAPRPDVARGPEAPAAR
ncbi:MAG: hypothetical protein JO057_27360 [Chloroflexi bacterium]|nr:hypothetical protein [Chloroflexota bacterium]